MSEERTCSKCGQTKPADQFYAGRAQCKTCKSAYNKAYSTRNSEKLREYQRRWKKEHPGKDSEYGARSYQKHKAQVKVRHSAYNAKNRFRRALWLSATDSRRHGYTPCSATPEEIEATFTGKCHACGKLEEQNDRRLHMDHDHVSGKFRGWLCTRCNKIDALASLEVPDGQ